VSSIGGSVENVAPSGKQSTARDAHRSRHLHRLIDVVLAMVWFGYAWATLSLWQETGAPVPLILLVRNSTLMLLFLARRPPKEASTSVKEWSVVLVSTLSGFLFVGGTIVAEGLALPLMVVSAILMTVSILALGRSFGIVPANRGIKSGGPYRIVRHPIYSCYVLFDIGYLMGAPTIHNGVIFIAVVVSLYMRARYEEKFLRADPAYLAYARQTRSMFLPGLL